MARDLLFNDGIDINNVLWNAFVGGVCGFIAGPGVNNVKDGLQVSKFISSMTILNNTIANGTTGAIARQTAAVWHHAKELIISGARYLFGNFMSIVGSELEGWWE